MSDLLVTVQDMGDGRRRRKAKEVQRDAKRRARRQAADEPAIVALVRPALRRNHPLHLLAVASSLIQMTEPDPLSRFRNRDQPSPSLDALAGGLTATGSLETTALLAVLAELLDGDGDIRDRCRREAAARTHRLPRWIAGLADVDVYRAVRMAHVLGDRDEVLIGARLVGGRELTCVALIDHNTGSEVKDAAFLPICIDEVIRMSTQRCDDPDVGVVEMDLNDGRAWVDGGLQEARFPTESPTWPQSRPLIEWLIRHMPEGGTGYVPTEWDWSDLCRLVREFFASDPGRPFADVEYQGLLEELLDTGVGDPLRWSAARIHQALSGPPSIDAHVSLEVLLSAPDLLRAFVPFAHAKSGIRPKLTSDAQIAIDETGPSYRRDVIREAKRWGYFDDDDYAELG